MYTQEQVKEVAQEVMKGTIEAARVLVTETLFISLDRLNQIADEELKDPANLIAVKNMHTHIFKHLIPCLDDVLGSVNMKMMTSKEEFDFYMSMRGGK